MTAADDAKRSRQRAASAAYRARQKAATQSRKPHSQPVHGGGLVEKAQADAQRIRAERAAILAKLPNARSIDKDHPLSENTPRIRPPLDTGRVAGPTPKTKAAQERRAAAIRQNVAAEKLQNLGRARKASLSIELTDGPISEELQEMEPHDRQRFREFADRITGTSAQSIGILFRHGGGQALYNEAIDLIRYKPTREAGMALLRSLAEAAEKAEELYSPRALKAQGLGDQNGRLNV